MLVEMKMREEKLFVGNIIKICMSVDIEDEFKVRETHIIKKYYTVK
jgi:hypothetical protein